MKQHPAVFGLIAFLLAFFGSAVYVIPAVNTNFPGLLTAFIQTVGNLATASAILSGLITFPILVATLFLFRKAKIASSIDG